MGERGGEKDGEKEGERECSGSNVGYVPLAVKEALLLSWKFSCQGRPPANDLSTSEMPGSNVEGDEQEGPPVKEALLLSRSLPCQKESPALNFSCQKNLLLSTSEPASLT